MQTEIITMGIVQTISYIVITLLVAVLAYREIKPYKKSLDKVVSIAEGISNESAEKTSLAFNSLVQIGEAAQNVTEALNDEELFEHYALLIAQKVKTVLHMTVLGTKSGNKKKLEKAERLINEGMVKASQELSPMLSRILKWTGLDEVLEDDPEMLGYILQVAGEKGLFEQFAPMMQQFGNMDLSSLATPADGPTENKGIEF